MMVLAAVGVAQPNSGATRVYTDTANGFSLRYPAEWRLQPNNPGYAVIFYADSGKNKDNYHTNVAVTLYDTTGKHSTLEGHRTRILSLIDAFTDSLIVESTQGTIMGGTPGHVLIYSGSQFGKQLKYLKGFVLRNGKVYHVTYTAAAGEFDRYDDSAWEMIRSFVFTAPAKPKKK